MDEIAIKVHGFIEDLRRIRVTYLSMTKQNFGTKVLSKNYFNFSKKKLSSIYTFFLELGKVERGKSGLSIDNILTGPGITNLCSDPEMTKNSRSIPFTQHQHAISDDQRASFYDDEKRYYKLFD